MAEGRVFLVLLPMTILLGVIFHFTNTAQPKPYMDEIFHIPQVQEYCNHNFSFWDNMITTLPGLYISSLLWTEPLQLITGLNFCTVQYLRSQNIIMFLACYLVVYYLLKSLHQRDQSSFLAPLSLMSFPLLFFFSFFYYTDVGSTTLVLTGYLLGMKQCYIASSLVLSCAVLFRQTNIIWSAFVAATVALKLIEPHIKKGGLVSQTKSLLYGALVSLPVLITSLWSYAILGVAFCVFVFVNGSIVVGDKSHHVASLHLPQFLYFLCFSCLLSVGPLLSRWKFLMKSLVSPKHLLLFFILTLVYLPMVHYYTYEHPYLLADNRHYTFYIWKNIFRSNANMKYHLIPLYSICTLLWITILAERQSKLWILFFFICCIAALIPQSLLEFRYYIIPYLLYRLHSRPVSIWGNVLECVHYNLINAVTLWFFLKRPFTWEGQDDLQRFMW